MENRCMLCYNSDDNEVIFGKFKKVENVVAHNNCLLLSMPFNPTESSIMDILSYFRDGLTREVARCLKSKCTYCFRLGANVKCSASGCTIKFHLKCGLYHLALCQYNSLKAYCSHHAPVYPYQPGHDEPCIICLAPLVDDNGRNSVSMAVQAPCCRNGWYHRHCLQMYANLAKKFRCPTCMNSDKFLEVSEFGIAIPNQRYSLPLFPETLPVPEPTVE